MLDYIKCKAYCNNVTWHSKLHDSPKTLNLKRNAKKHTFVGNSLHNSCIIHKKFSFILDRD